MENTNDSVELVCDAPKGSYPEDDCFSRVFSFNATASTGRANVKRLKTGQCRFSDLRRRFLESFTNLHTIDISHIGVKTLTELQLKHLQVFNASHNKLTEIKAANFRHMPEIREVDVSFNEISTLEFGAFAHLKALTSLNLSNNAIETIEVDSFENNKNLNILRLENNPIKRIDANIFSLMKRFVSVDFSWNKVKEIDTSTLGASLEAEFGPKCRMIFHGLEFKCEANAFQNLTYVNISGNQFENAEKIIELLGPSIEILDISSNFFSNFCTDAINASIQECASSDEIFNRFSNLQVLNVSRMNLSHFQMKTIQNMDKLKIFDLSFNQLRSLDFGSVVMKDLHTLKLEGNQLNEIKWNQTNLPKLSEFDIANNNLKCDFLQNFLRASMNLHIFNDSTKQRDGVDCEARAIASSSSSSSSPSSSSSSTLKSETNENERSEDEIKGTHSEDDRYGYVEDHMKTESRKQTDRNDSNERSDEGHRNENEQNEIKSNAKYEEKRDEGEINKNCKVETDNKTMGMVDAEVGERNDEQEGIPSMRLSADRERNGAGSDMQTKTKTKVNEMNERVENIARNSGIDPIERRAQDDMIGTTAIIETIKANGVNETSKTSGVGETGEVFTVLSDESEAIKMIENPKTNDRIEVIEMSKAKESTETITTSEIDDTETFETFDKLVELKIADTTAIDTVKTAAKMTNINKAEDINTADDIDISTIETTTDNENTSDNDAFGLNAIPFEITTTDATLDIEPTTSEDGSKIHYNIEAASMMRSKKSSIHTPKTMRTRRNFKIIPSSPIVSFSVITILIVVVGVLLVKSRCGQRSRSSAQRSSNRLHVPYKLDEPGDSRNCVELMDHIDFRDWNECAGHYHEPYDFD